jgi:hypothetical protein
MSFDASGKCSSPCGELTNYSKALSNMRKWAKEATPPGHYGYCNNEDYSFTYSDTWVYGPFSCGFKPSAEVWFKTTDSLFVTTAEERTEERSFLAADGANTPSDCVNAFSAAGLACPGALYDDDLGRCRCSETFFEFPAAVEHLAIEFDHGFTSEYQGTEESGASFLPRTIVRQLDCEVEEEGSCDLFSFPKETRPHLPIKTLLSKMGIDLDGNSCNQTGGQHVNAVNGVCPKVRVTGMQLELYMSFYNYNQHEPGGFTLNLDEDNDPVCIIEVSPTLKWTSMGNDIVYNRDAPWRSAAAVDDASDLSNRYRYGVTVLFKSRAGKISRFDMFSLISTLLEGVVLLHVASFLTTEVAKYLMPPVSKTYNAIINEKLSFTKELAKYACQTLSALQTFKAMDKDNTGLLRETELEAGMTEVLGTEMNPFQIRACTESVFEICDTQTGNSASESSRRNLLLRSTKHKHHAWNQEEREERGIDVIEFVEAATEDKFSFSILKSFFKGSASEGPAGNQVDLPPKLRSSVQSATDEATTPAAKMRRSKTAEATALAVEPRGGTLSGDSSGDPLRQLSNAQKGCVDSSNGSTTAEQVPCEPTLQKDGSATSALDIPAAPEMIA